MMYTIAGISQLLLLLVLSATPLTAWMVLPFQQTTTRSNASTRSRSTITSTTPTTITTPTTATSVSTTALHLAGFGKTSSAKTKKETKLKPKQQWDRYGALKKAESYKVGVSIVDDADADGHPADVWLEVGRVKSVDSQYTALAVARQRALIAEHAKRLYPLQISPKDTVAWAYWDNDEWVTVDKSILTSSGDNVPDNLEKNIGFEGKPDPATGFYCVYNEGRLVTGDEDARPSSKKLK